MSNGRPFRDENFKPNGRPFRDDGFKFSGGPFGVLQDKIDELTAQLEELKERLESEGGDAEELIDDLNDLEEELEKL